MNLKMAPDASAAPSVAPTGNYTDFNGTSSGNSTLTCFGTEPSKEILGQIIFYACFAYDYVIAFIKTLPLEFNIALPLVLGGAALVFLIFCCCCCCCLKKCCCPAKKDTKKKRKREKKEYEYLDPSEAPAIKSKRNPKTKFDMIPLVGTTIEEKVQPSLYSIPVNSMIQSSLSGEIGDEDPEGKLQLGRLQFSMKTSGSAKSPDLIVQVIQAVELNPQALSKNGTADPYVSVTLSPKNILYETNVERQNNDPMFQNTFTFSSVSKMSSRKLLFQAWHFDRINVSNPPIGEVRIELSKYDMEKPVEEWHKFKEVDQQAYRKTLKTMMRFGCLCLSLQYTPVMKRLTMYVLEASDLPPDPNSKPKKKGKEDDDEERGKRSHFEKDDDVKIDPMIKASLKLDGKKVKKAKTSTKQNTINPYFNEELKFEVSPEHIKRVELSVTLVHSATIGIPLSIGRVVFGPNSTGRARQQWVDMLDSPGRPVAQWHILANPKLKTK